MQTPAWWRGELALLYASMSVSRIGFGVMIILFPAYLLGYSDVSLAIALALYPILEAATAIPMGVACDRRGRRRVFLGGLLTMGCLMGVVSLTRNLDVVALLHALMGISAAAITVASLTMITDLTQVSNRGKGMGTFDFANIGGYAIGLLLGGRMAEAFQPDLGVAFLVTAGAMFAAVLASLIFLREPVHRTEAAIARNLNPLAGLDDRTKAVLPIWVSLTSLIGVVFYLPRALRTVGIRTVMTADLLFLGIVVIGIGSIGFGALSDRIGREKTMAIGVAGLSALLIGLGFMFADRTAPPRYLLFLPFLAPAGIATSALVPSILAAVGDGAKEANRGAAMGLYSLMLSLGIALGELLAGFASSVGGLPAILYAGSILFLVSSVLSFWLLQFVKRKERSRAAATR